MQRNGHPPWRGILRSALDLPQLAAADDRPLDGAEFAPPVEPSMSREHGVEQASHHHSLPIGCWVCMLRATRNLAWPDILIIGSGCIFEKHHLGHGCDPVRGVELQVGLVFIAGPMNARRGDWA
ncbi:MAG TPA: hypothetical protein VEF72_27855 [Mycobacterium sp.]|nr:hypothetical protein [Mycobacterium sp.]